MSKKSTKRVHCGFCNRVGRRSKEHVFPGWIRRHVHADGPRQESFGRYSLVTGEAIVPPKSRRSGALLTKLVCEDCNTGWMSRLETLARPCLLPLIRGEPFVLDAVGQEVLAAWACKTALAADLARHQQAPLDQSWRSYVCEHREAPPWAHVTLAYFSGPDMAFRFRRVLKRESSLMLPTPPTLEDANSVHLGLLIDHLILVVDGPRDPRRIRPRYAHRGLHTVSVSPRWSPEIVWPIAEAVTGGEEGERILSGGQDRFIERRRVS